MKRDSIGPGVLATGVTLVLLWAAVVSHAEPRVMTVDLKKIDVVNRTITIEFENEFLAHTLTVEPDAKIELNREQVDLRDIKPGMKVTVIGDLRTKKCTKISAKAAIPEKEAMPDAAADSAASSEMTINGDCPEELAALDKIALAYLAKEKVRGGVVIIVKNGRCVMSRAYGHADRDGTIPIDATTPFIVDGFSKILTGAAVIKLADEGKLDIETPFFEAIQVQPTAKEEDIPTGSRWVDAPTADFLKDRGQFHRDAFIREYQEDFDFRKKFNDKIRGMTDGQLVDLDENIKYDMLDLEYTMLGRLVAKLGGGKYEGYVQKSLLEPIGATGGKIIVLKRLKSEDAKKKQPKPPKGQKRATKSARQIKEEEIEEENKVAYEGTAQVQFEAGRDYQTTSMTLDAAGSWIATPKDIALFAKAFDDPENCPIMKGESIDLMLSRRGATVEADEEGAEEKPDSPKPAAGKPRGSKPYFASGWLVHDPPEGTDLHLSRRTFHSGPVAIASEDKLHIVVVLTTGFAASKSGAEHPLIAKLSAAAKGIKKWPDVDLFNSDPAVVENAPTAADPTMENEAAPGDAGGAPRTTLPRIPTVPVFTLRGRFESMINNGVRAYGAFLTGGGSRLVSDLKSSTSPNVADILKRNGAGIKAASTLAETFGQSTVETMFLLQKEVSEGDPKDQQLAAPVMSYTSSIAQLSQRLSSVAKNPAPADLPKMLADLSSTEEKMFVNLGLALSKMDEVYPLEVKPVANDDEFRQTIDRINLRLMAQDQRLQSVVANRTGRLMSIIAKGQGAPAEDQRLLPQLVKEIQTASNEVVVNLQKQRASVGKHIEVETTAATKYVPAWQAFAALVDAQIGQAQVVGKIGTADQKPEDEDKVLAALDTARTNFQQAMEALSGTPAGEPAPGQPTAEATPTEATPAAPVAPAAPK